MEEKEKLNLEKDLNEGQRIAVEYNDGPMLVIAGAGSGKTRMLTYKIAYLIQEGVKPWNILALTFTNKAADEMKERIGRLVGGEDAAYLNMGTFHSVFARILRTEASSTYLTSNYSIYDETDSQSLLRSIVKELGLDEKKYKPAAVHHDISMAKNNMRDVGQFLSLSSGKGGNQLSGQTLARIYDIYQQRLQAANAADFDDLLLLTYKLFFENETVRAKWEKRFRYILVDEYQDTNRVQQAVLEQLTRANRHICVVGDDSQSIYAFRGAKIENILSFDRAYPEAKIFKLERNYRSTQNIVKAANSIISHNAGRIPKEVYSENEDGEKILVRKTYADADEVATVIGEMERIRRQDGCGYSDFAVLYRTNVQSRAFEEAFRKNGIPYRIYGGLSFYQRKEIKDATAYFRLVVNPDDGEAFKRIVNYPARGIGQTTVSRIAEAASASGASLWSVCSSPGEYSLSLGAGAMNKIGGFTEMINSFRKRLDRDDAGVLGVDIVKQSGMYADLYAAKDPESQARQENIEELFNALDNFVGDRREDGRGDDVSLGAFLQEVSLLTDRENGEENEKEKVSLMTVHAAKGLEFPTVFVVGMDENIFPSQRSASAPGGLEEERRLFYVAVTRAAKHCILTSAKNRRRYGSFETFLPSRFLKDIDSRYTDVKGRKYEDDDDFENDGCGYGRNRAWGGKNNWGFRSSRYQNSRPAATQFVADRKYKITPPRREEEKADSFSTSFKKTLAAARRGGDSAPAAEKKAPAVSYKGLRAGMTILHERFGRGRVAFIEDSGSGAKATVDFEQSGRKQLLLKYAKYTVIG